MTLLPTWIILTDCLFLISFYHCYCHKKYQ